MFFNPFSHLSISKLYPLAKLRRSTLWGRFKDTFETIHGRMERAGETKLYSLSLLWNTDGTLQFKYFEKTIKEDGTLDSFLNYQQTLNMIMALEDGYDSAKLAFDNSGEVGRIWPTLLKFIPYLKEHDPSCRTESKELDSMGGLVLKSIEKPKANHVGVLDYIFFPILLPIAIYLKGNPGSSLAKVVNILKFPVSCLVTLCVSPFVFLAGAISSIVDLLKDQEVECLEIVADTEQSEKKTQVDAKTEKNLSQVVEAKDGCFVDKTQICTEVIRTTEITKVKKNGRELMLADIAPLRREKVSYSVDLVNGDPASIALDSIDNEVDCFPATGHDLSFFNVKIPITEKNKPALRWALESNYDHMLEKLEQKDPEGLAQLHASISKSGCD